ncbi:MAG: phage major capsid protein [Gammaproteobacteria bacterium]|nr:MAG: phage major capsid protein [candidate division Zixibacteria bacterium]RKZ99789.1 MAG: phage major capsid protein [Gammaproteobacteria bacterium]
MAVSVSEIISTTLRNRDRMVADNVTAHNGLLRTLEDTGKIKNAGGGRQLDEPLLYNDLATKWYDGFETFSIDTSQEVITNAVYQWKQLGGFSFISGKEEIMNREKWQAVSLAEARIDSLMAGLRNKMGLSLYSLGTGEGGKEIGGLRLLVSDDGLGTVGGIDASVETWWQNNHDVAAGDLGTDILTRMNAMHLACTRGSDQPDLIMADGTFFTSYWESLQENARHTSPKLADAGFRTLEFVGTPVVYDAQCATDLSTGVSGRMYFLNCNNLLLRKAPERYFSTEKSRKIENADYSVTPTWFMGNLTTNARFLQGVIGNTGA